MSKKSLDSFLEEVQNNQKEMNEGITLRDVADIEEIIDKVGLENFMLALINIFKKENAPVSDPEAVADYLQEIIRLQKQ